MDIDFLRQHSEFEWLEANGSGSFAMGCADRVPRRKYHSHFTIRDNGVGEAINILAELGETVATAGKVYLLYNLDFKNDIFPLGYQHLVSFSSDPYPCWQYQLDEIHLTRFLRMDRDRDTVRVRYDISGVKEPIKLVLDPLLCCRPIHRLAKENPFLNGAIDFGSNHNEIAIEPYAGVPRLFMKVAGAKAEFIPAGRWDKPVYYKFEEERGYEAMEDLYSPGVFHVEIASDASIVFAISTTKIEDRPDFETDRSTSVAGDIAGNLSRAAEKYLITKHGGLHTVVAGYPWFGDRARDALISLPGLCLETGNHAQARMILEDFGDLFMRGMSPDLSGGNDQIQNGLIDSPLLYIRAVQLLGQRSGKSAIRAFMPIVYHLLNRFKNSQDGRIQVTSDGGLFLGPGAAPMTWMNVTRDDRQVTPRVGFVIEANALFYNAVHFALDWAEDNTHVDFLKTWKPLMEDAEAAFMARFWSIESGYLADTFDGSVQDVSLRPNQLWALALPYSAVPLSQATRALEKIRAELLTPVGLRTLARQDPRYRGVCEGKPHERDMAYHQGSVWPWLIGIYADAVAKVYGLDRSGAEVRPIINRIVTQARSRACVGHIPELYDGDEPHHPRGAPAQAWSIAETLRVVAKIGKEREAS